MYLSRNDDYKIIITTLSATFIFDGYLDQYFRRYFSRTLWKVFLFYVKNIHMKKIHVKLWPRRIWISLYTDYGCLVAECVLKMLLQYSKFLYINWFHMLFLKITNSKPKTVIILVSIKKVHPESRRKWNSSLYLTYKSTFKADKTEKCGFTK